MRANHRNVRVQERLARLTGETNVLVEPSHSVVRPIVVIFIAGLAAVVAMSWLNRPAPQPIVSESVSPGAVADLVLVVDVVGDVKHPGLVQLAPGSRVNDSIQAAGGVTNKEALGMLNLAAKVTDGQQIVVDKNANAMSSGTSGSGKVNLNQATVDQLDTLPGVGPVLAGRIVDWRTANGSFHTIDELQEVPGVGPKVFANLSALISV